jgi:predicted RNA-binding Zn ribbon-like protein
MRLRNRMVVYHPVMASDHETARDLPADLALPLESGAPWWYFLGGRASVDFTNTLRERWWRRVETLVTPADLGLWLERAGVVPEAVEAGAAALAAARELREAIDAAFQAAIEGEAPAAGCVAVIDAWVARARPPLALRLEGGRVVLGEREADGPAERALAALALDAARVLADPALRRRLRVCASETCSARFFDNSPAGRRQWCSMRACGNVAKARRYRARHGRSAHGVRD